MFLIFCPLESIGESISMVKFLFASGYGGFGDFSKALPTFFPKRLPQRALPPLLSPPTFAGEHSGGEGALQDVPYRLMRGC